MLKVLLVSTLDKKDFQMISLVRKNVTNDRQKFLFDEIVRASFAVYNSAGQYLSKKCFVQMANLNPECFDIEGMGPLVDLIHADVKRQARANKNHSIVRNCIKRNRIMRRSEKRFIEEEEINLRVEITNLIKKHSEG